MSGDGAASKCKCSLCGSPGTNISTCPMNPNAINPNLSKHPLARIDHMDLGPYQRLPLELHNKIFDHLDISSLEEVAKSSKTMHAYTRDALDVKQKQVILENGVLLGTSTVSRKG